MAYLTIEPEAEAELEGAANRYDESVRRLGLDCVFEMRQRTLEMTEAPLRHQRRAGRQVRARHGAVSARHRVGGAPWLEAASTWPHWSNLQWASETWERRRAIDVELVGRGACEPRRLLCRLEPPLSIDVWSSRPRMSPRRARAWLPLSPKARWVLRPEVQQRRFLPKRRSLRHPGWGPDAAACEPQAHAPQSSSETIFIGRAQSLHIEPRVRRSVSATRIPVLSGYGLHLPPWSSLRDPNPTCSPG
jgi:hypothetical protein